MSVPTSERNPDERLNCITAAINFESYTIEILKNKKHFPEEFFPFMTSRLLQLTYSILDDLNAANSVRVISPEDFKLRRKLQNLAIGHIQAMNTQLMVAKKVFKIKNKRFTYWVRLLKDVKDLTQPWIASDLERYGHLLDIKKQQAREEVESKDALPEYPHPIIRT